MDNAKWLRLVAQNFDDGRKPDIGSGYIKAATEIESLRAEVARLKEELAKHHANFNDLVRVGKMSSEINLHLTQQLAAANAKIDELMLEYCPNEMTVEQVANYRKHQRKATPEVEAQLKAALSNDELQGGK